MQVDLTVEETELVIRALKELAIRLASGSETLTNRANDLIARLEVVERQNQKRAD